jgi:hypothetical protein
MSRRDDDQLIREMLAPEVEQAVEALGFWLRRHDRLPAYRPAARAEARGKIRYWQARVLADAPRAPLATIACAGPAVRVARLAVGYHARRLLHRTVLVTAAVLVLVVLASR